MPTNREQNVFYMWKLYRVKNSSPILSTHALIMRYLRKYVNDKPQVYFKIQKESKAVKEEQDKGLKNFSNLFFKNMA